MNATASNIEVGRLVHFFAGYGNIDGDGLIYAVHGTPNPEPPRSIFGGVGRVIRSNDCTVDVVLFDGRTRKGIHQCSINGVGIGYTLMDEVMPQEVIDDALRNAAKYETDKILAAAKEAEDFRQAEAARVIESAPIFYWNGIKDTKGAKLQRVFYSDYGPNGSTTAKYPPHTIAIHARDYNRFSDAVRKCFVVQNDTDTMVDYFDNDTIRVIPEHPLYPQVKAALEAKAAHYDKRATKRGGNAQKVAA